MTDTENKLGDTAADRFEWLADRLAEHGFSKSSKSDRFMYHPAHYNCRVAFQSKKVRLERLNPVMDGRQWIVTKSWWSTQVSQALADINDLLDELPAHPGAWEPTPASKALNARVPAVYGGLLIVFLVAGHEVLRLDMPAHLALALLIPIAAIGLVLYLVLYAVGVRQRRVQAQRDAHAILRHKGPYTLFLRSFGADKSRYLSRTFEEQLEIALRPIGKMIAIGRPGEGLPPLGATRLYTQNARWHATVTNRMKKAALVVLQFEPSDGLLWELRTAVEVVAPENLLILLMGVRSSQYEALRQQVEPLLRVSFPELKGTRIPDGFIRFGSDWTPEFLPLGQGLFRRGRLGTYRAKFTYILRPVLKTRGLGERPPKQNGK